MYPQGNLNSIGSADDLLPCDTTHLYEQLFIYFSDMLISVIFKPTKYFNLTGLIIKKNCLAALHEGDIIDFCQQ